MTTVATKNQTNLFGFEKWKLKNPEGTLEQYLLAREKATKKIALQFTAAIQLPDGTICPLNAATIQDVAPISSEHVRVSATNQ